ncbi:MAG: hypothetical protein F4187_07245 [Gemmatimonadetes bacterium]|nr:hypothetical protein [Gemmatimonadota bacterium]
MNRFTSATTDLRAHAVLFAMAVIAALLTWNRDVSFDENEAFIRVWDRDSADVRLVHYQTPELDLRIERRTDAAGDYLWGTQIGGMDGGPDTLDFPIGPAGAALVGRIARLRTLREMGELSPELKRDIGVEGSTSRLLVRFTDEERELILGDPVYGFPDQYAFEAATGLGYVLSREVMQALGNGQGNVRERWLHHFPTEVAQVRVQVGGRMRAMSPAQGGEWMEVGGGAPDLAFATFMQRVDQLAIEGFIVRPAPENVTTIMRAEYLGEGGESIGFVELMRDDSADNPYFVRTETTRIPAQAVEFLAQRVEEGLDGVFSGAEPGSSSSAARSAG